MNRDRTPEPAVDDVPTDLLTRLRPRARMDEAWSVDLHRAAHRQVMARIDGDAPVVAAARPRAGGRGGPTPARRPWFTPTAAAGVAAAVAVIALGAPGATDRPDAPRPAATAERPTPTVSTPPPPSSSVFLQGVALVAAEQPDENRDAPWWYTKVRVDAVPSQLGPSGRPYVREDWSGRVSGHRYVSTAESGAVQDQDAWEDPSFWSIGYNRYTWDQLDQVPTDPAALKELFDPELADYATSENSDVDQHLWQAIGDLLRDTPASPALRRGLYELLATIPDVTVREDVTDAVGRRGTLVTRTQRYDDPKFAPMTYEVLIDPVTGVLLQEQMDSPTGKSFYRSTYLAQGGVDDDHATLPGG